MKSNLFFIWSIYQLLSLACLANILLRPETELIRQCYDFPEVDFGRTNNVRASYGISPHLVLNAGEMAINFTLPSVNGRSINLAEMLVDKAVLLIWGHWTCPAFQGLHSDTTFMYSSYNEENYLVETYGQHLTILHFIGPEPHPAWPYANFDSGTLRMNLWSTIKQPQTFAERLSLSVSPVLKLLHEDIIVIAEPLDNGNSSIDSTGPANNPIWCSYANGARSAILVGQDGVVLAAQTWFQREDLERIILSQLVDTGANTGTHEL